MFYPYKTTIIVKNIWIIANYDSKIVIFYLCKSTISVSEKTNYTNPWGFTFWGGLGRFCFQNRPTDFDDSCKKNIRFGVFR
uniref:Uncharacterized protein n=1 Tax=viral metagenome TaxID=1070528 RepID=A0A6C0AVI6_9ZZZZ